MDIYHLGHSSFRIRGKQATVVTDPFSPEDTGLKFPKVEGDIVTISHNHKDHNQASLVEGNPQVFMGPGEYEVKGVKLFGLTAFHDAAGGAERGRNIIFQIEMDGLRIVHLGDLGDKLNTEQAEILSGADILMIPVGGKYSLNAKLAVDVIAQLEPFIVIPMHYSVPKLKFELEPVVNFLKEFGKEDTKPLPKLSISKDKVPEELEVVVLE